MSRGLGAKVYIDGEKEFKQSISQINAELRAMKSELGSVSSSFDKNTKTVGDAKRQNEHLEKVLQQQKQKLEEQRNALDHATIGFGEADKRTLAWRESVARTETEINKLTRQIEQNEKSIDDVSGVFLEAKDSVLLYGDSTEKAGQQSLRMGDIIKANLISEGIISGVKALASAMKSVVNAAVDFAKDGIAFNSMVEDYQMSFETMTGSAELAKEMMEDIKKTAKETPFEIDGMADSVKQMMAYGIEGKKSLELTKLLGDVSQGNNEKMNSMAYAMGQISSAGILNGQDLRQLINAGFNPLEEMARTTGRSLNDLKDDMSKGLITYEDVEKSLKSITSEGGRFHNAMNNASKTFSGQTAMMEEGFTNLKGMVTEGLFESLADSVMPMINNWIDELTEGFENDGLEGLIGAIENIIPQAMEYIMEQLPMILEIGMGILTTIAQGIIDALPSLVEPVKEILLALVKFVIDNLPMIIEVGIEILFALIEGLIDALPELIPAIFELMGFIVMKIIENLPRIFEMGIQLIGAIIEGLWNALGDLLSNIGDIIGDMLGKFVDSLGDFLAFGIDLLINIGEGLVEGTWDLLVQAGNLAQDLFDAFLEIDWIQLGMDIITGIGKGIGNLGGWLVDQGKGAVDWLVGGVKGFLGIESPSKVMRDEVGAMMAKGLGIGFHDEMEKVNVDINKAVPDVEASLSVTNDSQTNKIDTLISLTEQLLRKNQDIYLDTGQLIGSTVGGMDIALSNNLSLKSRGR